MANDVHVKVTVKRMTAEDAYTGHHFAAQNLLERIDNRLHCMPAPGGDYPIDWADAGTVGHVVEMLRDVERFLAGDRKR